MIGTDEIVSQGTRTPPPNVARAVEQLIFGEDPSLPMLPEVALEVMKVCRDPDADPRTLAALVERDPQIAGRVTRMANSAAYASVAPILSLPQALSRLGFSRVSEIALAVACQARLFDIPGFESRLRGVLYRSALAGGFAREIARRQRRNVEEAFLAGLLHDIGKPLVLQAAVDAGALNDEGAEPYLETLLQRYHALAGARLIESWALGEELATVVATQHADPELDQVTELWHLLSLSGDLADAVVADPEVEAPALQTVCNEHASVEPLNLYREDTELIMTRLSDVHAFAEILA